MNGAGAWPIVALLWAVGFAGLAVAGYFRSKTVDLQDRTIRAQDISIRALRREVAALRMIAIRLGMRPYWMDREEGVTGNGRAEDTRRS